MADTLSEHQSRVVVVGSVNIDLVIRGHRLPGPGETVLGGEFYRTAGGKGANQAVAAARSSRLPVTFIAAVGDDEFGRESARLLREENLDGQFIKSVSDRPSGVALIMVDGEGENSISVASGANADLLPADIAAVDDAVFQEGTVLLTSLETPLETVTAALRRARDAQLVTILNPAPATSEIADAGILSLVDVFTPNESEAELLTGIPPTFPDDAVRAALRLRKLGCRAVVLTRGAEGVLIADSAGTELLPAYSVEAVDTTAAGDAFNGVLATALSEGQPLRNAVRRASAAAALSVTRRGAQPSLPRRDEIDRFVKSPR